MERVLVLLGLFVLLAMVGKAQSDWKDVNGEYINAHGGAYWPTAANIIGLANTVRLKDS